MSTPSSPLRHRQPTTIPGFRPSQRPARRPISEMTIRELQDLRKLNARILASPGASTSTYVQRVSNEQAAIESRLLDLDGIEKLGATLKRTQIKGEADMEVDGAEELPVNRTIEAKRKALAQYGKIRTPSGPETNSGSSFTLQEAIELERQAYIQDKERQQRILEKKKRLEDSIGISGKAKLSRAEQDARIWAFLNYKPTDSDLEDEDEDDEDDDDPSTWFEDDQDDGIKGQNIVEPDFEDEISHIIQVDRSRGNYDSFYQPGNGEN
ncbi:hypothetical protein FA15DRAFT_664301 [Coprinopsis marcescibilis]|uniref:Uncharacterized protein n=1 Tax=Coprinopsis marcescibilis TaxID=230819 RepID=A0A5C3L9A4_COPMA|nr:hypothetical protein FA15DRAFT_664301 [Coprinopsis marcescibilis]